MLAILTSVNTFSAPEELAYDLKQLKRATIVGEKTAGGANLRGMFKL
jgi:retinol-binding protein 3